MNCSEAEQLFDAYLDGQLTGSLRLELDAHRLGCRRCQQTLAMMETCAHVLATDREGPELSPDFTERVMAKVARGRLVAGRLRSTRVAVAVGFVLQAAAVLLLAIIFQSRPARPVARIEQASADRPAGGQPQPDTAANAGYGFPELLPRSAGRGLLAAFAGSVDDLGRLARYGLNIDLPGIDGLGMFSPGAAEESPAPPTPPDQYAL